MASTEGVRFDARGNRTTSPLPQTQTGSVDRCSPDGSRVTFVYASIGNRTIMADTTGTYTSTCDALSQSHVVTSPGAKSIAYAWDAVGSRSTMLNPDGSRTTYAYSAAGQPSGRERRDGRNVAPHTTLPPMKTPERCRREGRRMTFAAGEDPALLHCDVGDGGVVLYRTTEAFGVEPLLGRTATGKRTTMLVGHKRRVMAVAFSPDGSTLASGAANGVLKLWRTETRANVATWEGHHNGDPVLFVAFSPDGRILASASPSNEIKLWNAATGKRIDTIATSGIRGHVHGPHLITFNPDGESIASAGMDGVIRFWSVEALPSK